MRFFGAEPVQANCQFITGPAVSNVLTIRDSQVVATIDADGIFRVNVDPTDENAKLFVELVEKYLSHRTLTSMQINACDLDLLR